MGSLTLLEAEAFNFPVYRPSWGKRAAVEHKGTACKGMAGWLEIHKILHELGDIPATLHPAHGYVRRKRLFFPWESRHFKAGFNISLKAMKRSIFNGGKPHPQDPWAPGRGEHSGYRGFEFKRAVDFRNLPAAFRNHIDTPLFNFSQKFESKMEP